MNYFEYHNLSQNSDMSHVSVILAFIDSHASRYIFSKNPITFTDRIRACHQVKKFWSSILPTEIEWSLVTQEVNDHLHLLIVHVAIKTLAICCRC